MSVRRASYMLLAPCIVALAGCGPGPAAQEPAVTPVTLVAPVDVPSPTASSAGSDLSVAPAETLRIEAISQGVLIRCLGVLVAPRVALTASHCVEGRSGARVRLARLESGGFVAVERFWSDPRAPMARATVDSKSADVAVLLLARAIALPSYPEIARHPAPGSIAATGLRRAGDRIETTELSLQPPRGSAYYVSEAFAKRGDSGGPVYFVGTSGKRIVVAVMAGGNTDREVLTRVDLVAGDIDRAIAMSSTHAHGP